MKGKIITENGLILTPSYAQTRGRRYRYYIERRKGGAASKLAGRPIRLPAAEIESSVRTSLAGYLARPIKLIDSLGLSKQPQEMQQAISCKAEALAGNLNQPIMDQAAKAAFMQLVKRVELKGQAEGYRLIIDMKALTQRFELSYDSQSQDPVIGLSLKLKVCNNGKK